jgi:ankyrin repeat protein
MKNKAARAFARLCIVTCALAASRAANSGPNEDLLAAAPKGDLVKLERAIKDGADVEARNDKKSTALMLAAENGKKYVVQTLLAAGAKADATREGGVAAIHVACAKGEIEIVKALLAAGVNVNTATEKRLTPILAAGRSGNIDLLRLLAEAGADKSAMDASSVSLLMTSAQSGCVECMEFARTPQTDFNATTTRGYNLLDFALASRKGPAVQYVLDAGGKLSEHGRKGALFSLIANPADQLSQIPPVDVKVIRTVIAAGAALEGTDEDGMTPLLAAIKAAPADTVEALLEAKANIAAVDKKGEGALAIAAQRDGLELMKWMLDISKYQGGPVNDVIKPAGRSDVWPPTARRLEITRRLIAAGAAVNATSKRGDTPLHNAVDLGDVELTELLLGAGANVNAVDDGNTTPLMVATRWSFEACVAALLAAGADKSIANKHGDTPLSVARKNKSKNIVALLDGKKK